METSLSNPDPRMVANARKYESVLWDIQKHFPATLSYKPTKVATSTLAARIRDALKAVCDDGVLLGTIDGQHLCRIRPDLRVVRRGDSVLIGHKDNLREDVDPGLNRLTPDQQPQGYLFTLENPSDESVNAVLHLASLDCFDHPVLLQGVDPTALSAPAEVAIHILTPTSCTIL